jgi:hypothetical protein
MEQRFIFSRKYKVPVLILISVGVLTAIASFIIYHDHGARFWSNLLLNNVYFIMISLCGVVFLALHSLATSGWQVSIQRIPEAISSFLPVGGVLMLVMLLGLLFNWHHLYHWAHTDHSDKILEMKKAYLNIPFFILRTIIYLGGWSIFAHFMRKNSVMQDSDPDLKYFRKNNILSAVFIVFFAITSSGAAWDWIMSIDPHWFSTLFGWYVFSGLLVSGIATIILIVLLLKSGGYLAHVNHEHLHDLGKYLFAFSILWTYLWFSQYMLIWYGNLPEETIYFVQRLKDYKTLFFINLIVNFSFPLLALMTRDSKRTNLVMALVAFGLIIGHWIDFYLMIMPGTLGPKAGIGIVEIGMTLGYIGLFLWVVLSSLAKANLVPANHPYYKESLDYHTQY